MYERKKLVAKVKEAGEACDKALLKYNKVKINSRVHKNDRESDEVLSETRKGGNTQTA